MQKAVPVWTACVPVMEEGGGERRRRRREEGGGERRRRRRGGAPDRRRITASAVNTGCITPRPHQTHGLMIGPNENN